MKPVTHPDENVVYKGPTPDIGDLSCWRAKPGLIFSEWDLTIRERLAVLRGAHIELGIHTEPIPPVSLAVRVHECGHAPMPWSGAYGHWRCQRRRFHFGPHRFNNYTIRRGARLYGGIRYALASVWLVVKKRLRLTQQWRVVLRRTTTKYDPVPW